MITHTETRQVDSNNIAVEKTCNVNINAHLMQILSGLYKDPIKAIVREYTSNMADAYRALLRQDPNAQIIPGEIMAPSPMEPTMIFKDYGVGMDEETLESVFFAYNASTKNKSNDEVGGFGLGAKTAYTYNSGSPWTVESRYNGKLLQYIAYVNKDGVSSFTKVSETPTTEPNGITIKIAVRRPDINAFQKWTKVFCFYFPFPYTTNVEITNAKTILENKNKWRIFSTDLTYGHSLLGHGLNDINLIIGGVPYRAPIQHLNSNEIGVAIHIPIGSIKLTPNRDEIVDSQENIDKIKQFMNEFEKDTQLEVSKKVHKTEWERYTFFRYMNRVTAGAVKRPEIEFEIGEFSSDTYSYPLFRIKDEYRTIVHNPGNLDRDNPKLYINDIDHKLNTLFLNRIRQTIFIDKNLTKKEVSALFGNCPESIIEYISDIIPESDRILRAKSIKRKKVPGCVRLYNYNESTYKWSYGEEVELTTGNTFYYVVINKDFTMKSEEERQAINLFYSTFKSFNKAIVGIGEKYIKDIDGKNNFVPLISGIEEWMKNLIETEFVKKNLSFKAFLNVQDCFDNNTLLCNHYVKDLFAQVIKNLSTIFKTPKLLEYEQIVDYWKKTKSKHFHINHSFAIKIAEKVMKVKYDTDELEMIYRKIQDINPFITIDFLEKFHLKTQTQQQKMIQVFQDAGVLDISF